jgi:hypothetical protein
MEKMADLVLTGLLLSLTVNVKFAIPLVVGIPLIIPVEGCSDKPAGSDPEETVHVYCGVPPLITSVPLYGLPWIADTRPVVLMESGTAVFVDEVREFDE